MTKKHICGENLYSYIYLYIINILLIIVCQNISKMILIDYFYSTDSYDKTPSNSHIGNKWITSVNVIIQKLWAMRKKPSKTTILVSRRIRHDTWILEDELPLFSFQREDILQSDNICIYFAFEHW